MKSKTKWFLSTKKNVIFPSYIRLILQDFNTLICRFRSWKLELYHSVLFLLSSEINQSFRCCCCCCCSPIQIISKSFNVFFFPLINLFTPKAAEFVFATNDVCKLNGKQRKGVKQKSWKWKPPDGQKNPNQILTRCCCIQKLSLSLCLLKVSPPHEERVP